MTNGAGTVTITGRAPGNTTISFWDYQNTGLIMTMKRYLYFIQNHPIIWYTSLYGYTSGGTLTLTGNYFLDSTAACPSGSGATNVTFLFPSGASVLCPILTYNFTQITCQYPAGQNSPIIILYVCGFRQLDIPRFAGSDLEFYSIPGNPGGMWCIPMANPWTSSGWTWNNDQFCQSASRGFVDWRWYTAPTGSGATNPIPVAIRSTYRCVKFFCNLVTAQGACSAYWPNHWLCVPVETPYQITFYEATVQPATNCVQIRERWDPWWTLGGHFICIPANTPYPDGDTLLMYHYANPVISSLVPNHGPTIGGINITISGTSFGLTPLVTVGGNNCPVNYFASSHFTIICVLPTGTLTSNAVIVSVPSTGSQYATSNSVNFAYDPPVINNIVPANGPTQGGQNITLTGADFGKTGTVTINNNNCVPSFWNDSTIVCATPAGQGQNLFVLVTSAFQTNLVPYVWSYLPPSISSVNPGKADTNGNVKINITGSSFGTLADSIKVGTSICSQPTQTNTLIICTLAPGVGYNLAVTVVTSGQTCNPCGIFSYNPPNITYINPTGARSGTGAMVNIYGYSFGLPFGTVTINGAPCSFASGTWTHNWLLCAVPNGAGANVPLNVSVCGQNSNIVYFSYAPVVYSYFIVGGLSPTTVGGVIVDIVGAGFSYPNVTNSTVTIAGSSCKVLTQMETAITCVLPVGSGTSQPLVVTTAGQTNVPFNFNYAPPAISAILPGNCPTVGGVNITMSGSSFGAYPGATTSIQMYTGATSSVTYTNANCFINHTTIICLCSAGSGGNRQILVTTASQTSSVFYYTYDAPVLKSLFPLNGPTIGGFNITLTGNNFSTAAVSAVVLVNGVVNPLLFHNETMAIFTMPAGSGANDINLFVDSLSSNTLSFNFDLANITNISPTHGLSGGGYTLNVTGVSFGVTGSVSVGTSNCPVTFYGQTFIQCTVPPGQGTGFPVSVTSSFRTSNSRNFSYDAPIITGVTPLTAITDGGTIITITGTSFGSSGTLLIGTVPCDQAGPGTSWGHTQVLCQLRAGQGTNYPISIIVSGQTNTVANQNAYVFSYLPPVVSTLLPSNGPTVGGISHVITMYGANFGLLANVTFGSPTGSICTFVGLGQSHTVITCASVPGQGPSMPIYVSVGGQISAPVFYNYDAPVISNINPLVIPTQGNVPVTLTGSNFGTGVAGVSASNNYTVYVNSVALSAAAVTFINHTLLVFSAPRGYGTNIPVSVTVATQTSSYTGTGLLSYAAPTITSVSGCISDAYPNAVDCPVNNAGYPVTITGTNFGNNPSVINVTIGTLNCTFASISSADTVITCGLQPQPHGGFNVAVKVSIAGQSVSQPYLSYSGPVLKANTIVLGTVAGPSTGAVVLASDPTVGVTAVYFAGRNFGTSEPAVTITYGVAGSTAIYSCGVVAGTLSTDSKGNSSVACYLSAGAGENLVFQVQVGLLLSPQGTDTLTYPQPVITGGTIRGAVSDPPGTSYTGKFSQGDVVSFDVSHVGPTASQIAVTYGYPGGPYNQVCGSVTLTGTTLSCITSAGSGVGYVFVVNAVNYPSVHGTDTYNYVTAPLIYSVHGCADSGNVTNNCATIGGALITITGDYYGSSALSVRIGSNACTPVNFVSSQQLTCTLAAGAGLNQPVTVVYGNQFSSPAFFLSYATATITGVTGCPTSMGSSTADCARAGGTTITVTGNNFGPPSAIVLVGGSQCTNLVQDPITPQSKLTCTLAAGTALLDTVMFIQNGGSLTTATQTVSYLQCAAGSAAAVGVIACSACSAGTYTGVAGLSACTPCPIGSFNTGTGNTACTSCSQGSYSASSSATTCTACSTGQYIDIAGSAGCLPCPIGTFANASGSSTCTACSAGYSNSGLGASSCSACTAGYAVSYSGAVSCSPCPDGTAANSNTAATACINCAVGYYSASGATSCSACGAGYYQSAAGQSSCVGCDTGYFANTTALSACYSCNAGTISVKSGAQGPTSCSSCTAGFYQVAPGQGVCLQCPTGKTILKLTHAPHCTLCRTIGFCCLLHLNSYLYHGFFFTVSLLCCFSYCWCTLFT